MTQKRSRLLVMPCLDSAELAAARRRELDIDRPTAVTPGHSAVQAAKVGHYTSPTGRRVEWGSTVGDACRAKESIPPEAVLPDPMAVTHAETRIQVSNETTLQASRRLFERGLRPLALNFANGIHPGGGFLSGARAQEEVLCRSSSLYLTLVDDPMYEAHRRRPRPDSTDWSVHSPDVPVFRNDDGTALEEPWLLSFVSCAAPFAPTIGQPEAGDLLKRRIHRVLAIAKALEYSALVLGAWGCGAFGNDPRRTARDFREALETEFEGTFADVVFAITDWSPERMTLGPFRDAFAADDVPGTDRDTRAPLRPVGTAT